MNPSDNGHITLFGIGALLVGGILAASFPVAMPLYSWYVGGILGLCGVHVATNNNTPIPPAPPKVG